MSQTDDTVQYKLVNDERLQSGLIDCNLIGEWAEAPPGIPVVHDGRICSIPAMDGPTLTIGSTGKGKTLSVLDPLGLSILRSGNDLIFCSTKAQDYRYLASAAEAMGYEWCVFDPANAIGSFNAFQYMNQMYQTGDFRKLAAVERMANDFVISTVPATSDPQWSNRAREYLTCLITRIFKMRLPDVTIEDILDLHYRYMEGKQEMLFKDLENLDRSSACHRGLRSFAETTSVTQSGFRSVIETSINALDNGLNDRISVSNSMDLDLFGTGDKPHALFITISDVDMAYHPLVSILISYLSGSLVLRADSHADGRLERPVHFLLDEAVRLHIPALPTMYSTFRSRRIMVHVACQDFMQLFTEYGKDVAKGDILANATTVFLGSSLFDTNRYMAELLGDDKEFPVEDMVRMTSGTAIACGGPLIRPIKVNLTRIYDYCKPFEAAQTEQEPSNRPHYDFWDIVRDGGIWHSEEEKEARRMALEEKQALETGVCLDMDELFRMGEEYMEGLLDDGPEGEMEDRDGAADRPRAVTEDEILDAVAGAVLSEMSDQGMNIPDMDVIPRSMLLKVMAPELPRKFNYKDLAYAVIEGVVDNIDDKDDILEFMVFSLIPFYRHTGRLESTMYNAHHKLSLLDQVQIDEIRRIIRSE